MFGVQFAVVIALGLLVESLVQCLLLDPLHLVYPVFTQRHSLHVSHQPVYLLGQPRQPLRHLVLLDDKVRVHAIVRLSVGILETGLQFVDHELLFLPGSKESEFFLVDEVAVHLPVVHTLLVLELVDLLRHR